MTRKNGLQSEITATYGNIENATKNGNSFIGFVENKNMHNFKKKRKKEYVMKKKLLFLLFFYSLKK